jgi:hypothetical protein
VVRAVDTRIANAGVVADHPSSRRHARTLRQPADALQSAGFEAPHSEPSFITMTSSVVMFDDVTVRAKTSRRR